MKTVASGRKSPSKVLSGSFEDPEIGIMRDRIAAKKKKVAEAAAKKLSTKTGAPKTTRKAEADDEGRKLTKHLDRALQDCV